VGASSHCLGLFHATGASQDIAVTTARTLEARIEEIAMAMSKPESAEQKLQRGRNYVAKFAEPYPLKSLYFQREPISGRPESVVLADSASFGAIASGMEQDVITLQRLLSAYMEYMPTLVRWQGELMLYDVERSGSIADSVSVLKEMPNLVRDVMTMQVPQLVSSETTRALSALSTERMNTVAGLENMRMATLRFVEQERMTVVAEVDKQRVATIGQVSEGRKAALGEIGAIARESTGSVLSVGKALIDHLMWKLGMLVDALGVVVALAGGILLALMRLRKLQKRGMLGTVHGELR
jgi:hypothetical protein